MLNRALGLLKLTSFYKVNLSKQLCFNDYFCRSKIVEVYY